MWGCLGFIEGERRSRQSVEVVSQPLAVALSREIPLELPGVKRGEGECEARDGGDLPLRGRINVQSSSDIVQLSYRLLASVLA